MNNFKKTKIIILLFTIFSSWSLSYSIAEQADLSHQKIGFLFAMKEEAQALNSLGVKIEWQDDMGYKVANFKYKNHLCTAILTGVGKSLSAGGAVLLLAKYKPDIVLNVGTAGGINCDVGDIILSQRALFHDVDLASIHLPKYKLPDLPKVLQSEHNLITQYDIKNKIPDSIHIKDGLVISSDQFLHRAQYYREMLKVLPDVKATEMEAASIGAICHRAHVDFLFIKKISNRADDNADNRFSSEVLNFTDKVGAILKAILNS